MAMRRVAHAGGAGGDWTLVQTESQPAFYTLSFLSNFRAQFETKAVVTAPYPLNFRTTNEAPKSYLLFTAPPVQDAKERVLLGDVSFPLLEQE